jgi:hypothetical protein
LDLHGLSLNDDTPVLECLLGKEVAREILDGLELLLRILATRCKHVTHASRVFSDTLRDTIDCAELRWDVALLAVDLHDEEGLLQVSDFHVIGLVEVLSDGHLLAIVCVEAHGDRGLLEVDIFNDVGLLVAVCADD